MTGTLTARVVTIETNDYTDIILTSKGVLALILLDIESLVVVQTYKICVLSSNDTIRLTLQLNINLRVYCT